MTCLRLMVAALSMILLTGTARIAGAQFFVEPAIFPGTNAFVNIFSCYNVVDGKLLNCNVSYFIEGLVTPTQQVCTPPVVHADQCSNGGHQHDFAAHPLLDARSGSGLRLFVGGALQTSTTQLNVSFQTQNNVAVLLHTVPEVAGMIQIQTFFTPPPGFVCLANCAPRYPFAVKAPNLQLLPTPDPDYAVSGGTTTHPQNHWGKSETLEALREIAQKYHALSGRRLSVNDISLPLGGLFDISSAYAPPHHTHRLGTNADIDRAGVNCNIDDKLKRAIQKVSKQRPSVRLICENTSGRPDPNGPFKHINFE